MSWANTPAHSYTQQKRNLELARSSAMQPVLFLSRPQTPPSLLMRSPALDRYGRLLRALFYLLLFLLLLLLGAGLTGL